MLYAIIAGMVVWLVVNILSHVHVAITWHQRVASAAAKEWRTEPVDPCPCGSDRRFPPLQPENRPFDGAQADYYVRNQ